MLSVNTYNFKGITEEKSTLPKALFDAEINQPLLSQSVRVYLSNQRKAHAHTKTRGEVIGSTRKIYRQKGTGKARHGDIKAPVFVGGGKAHGPTGEQNYKLSFPSKMRKVALASALTLKYQAGEVFCLEGLAKNCGKTKEIMSMISLVNKESHSRKFLLVISEKLGKISQSARNIKGLKISTLKELSAYEVLNNGLILFAKEVFEKQK